MRAQMIVALVLVAAAGCGSSRLDGSGSGGSPGGGLGGAAGTVTFVLTVPGGFSFCDQVSCPEPATQHLTIQTPDGATLNWPGNSCGTTDCGTCAPVQCSVTGECPIAHGEAYTGGTVTWDGAYLGTSTCGASGTACAESRHATPGQYIAQFCATQGTLDPPDSGLSTCTNTAPTVCTLVPFTYPSDTPVQIQLPVYHRL
jgi:hypothetical protein